MIDTGKAIIVEACKGVVKAKRVVEGSLHNIVKEEAKKALDKWDPSSSNFDIILYEHDVERLLPLKPEEVDMVLKLEPTRMKDRVIFTLPIYIISYKNYRSGEVTIDEEVIVVAPYITDDYISYVEEVAILTTKEEKQ